MAQVDSASVPSFDPDDTYEFPMLRQRAPVIDQMQHDATRALLLSARLKAPLKRINRLIDHIQRSQRLKMKEIDYQKEIGRLKKLIRDRELDDLVKGLFRSKRARNHGYGIAVVLCVMCFFVGLWVG